MNSVTLASLLSAPAPESVTDSNVTVGLSSSGCVVLRGIVGIVIGGEVVFSFKSSGLVSAKRREENSKLKKN